MKIKKRQKKNQGNSFIVVVATLSFLAVLTAALLVAVALCYRLKAYDINAKDNFYYLEQAMDEAEGLEYVGEEGPYGIQVNSVNGEEAIYETDAAYWGFFVNGEYCNYGVSEQPVADGDAFQIVFTLAE